MVFTVEINLDWFLCLNFNYKLSDNTLLLIIFYSLMHGYVVNNVDMTISVYFFK